VEFLGFSSGKAAACATQGHCNPLNRILLPSYKRSRWRHGQKFTAGRWLRRLSTTFGLLRNVEYGFLAVPDINPPRGAMMTEATAERRYAGVHCYSCGEPIPVPARIAKKATARDAEGSEAAQEINPAVFNLRCKVCEKENFYGTKDVREMEGEPRLTRPRARAAGSLLRPSIKLARTANA
jgi:hypothetical protein